MLPSYERLGGTTKPVFRIPFGKMTMIVVSLPFFGFAFCVIWSLVFNFQSATSTHCDVPNYLPSISAAIGSFEPQKTVWRLAICLHLPARLAVAKMYLRHYRDNVKRQRRTLATIACSLNIIEDFALLSLSLWTSGDDYVIHRNAFIVFIACSELYMLFSLFLNNNSGRKLSLTPIEAKSLQYKRILFLVNVISFALAGYFFLRHNAHCEAGVYTLFAFFEYIVVLTNMAYHVTAYWDFYALTVCFDWKDGIHLTQF